MAPSSLCEMIKLSFGKLIFKGIMTCPYESLPYSSTPRFVFYLFFFLIVPLLLISSSFLFASCHAHCWFLRRAPLCFIFFVAAQCWLLVVLVGFIFFQVSYPFRMNVLFNSLLCIHVMLFHLWEIYCFVLNERVGLLSSMWAKIGFFAYWMFER